jgi:hypothetical protein
MTMTRLIPFGLLMVGLASAAALSAVVTGVAQVTHPALAAVSGQAMWAFVGLFLFGLCTFAADRAQAVAPHRVCSYCRTSVPETQGYICAGQRFACDTCCASDVRAIVLPQEAA